MKRAECKFILKRAVKPFVARDLITLMTPATFNLPKMPVAVPLRPELSAVNEDNTEEEEEIEEEAEVEDVTEEDEDDDEWPFSETEEEDEFEEFGRVAVSVNGLFFPQRSRLSGSQASQDPFNEFFSYQEARGLGNGTCSHPSRPARYCRHCPAKFSPVLFTSCQLMHQSIFGDKVSFKRSNPLYQPKHSLVTEQFKAITAMHDSAYIRSLFEEIINYICFLQNQQLCDCKSEQTLKTKLFWLYEFVERLFLSLQEQTSTEELILIGTFRAQLKAIGLCSRFDENVQLNRALAQECQR